MTLSELGAVLNFLIVLVFVYMMLSLAASMVVEAIASVAKQRSKMLRARITEMFDDVDEQGFAGALFNSPLLKTYRDGKRLPAYLPSPAFAQAVVAILKETGKTTPDAMDPVLKALAKSVGVTDIDTDLDTFRGAVADWYDQVMGRLSGAYKRWARLWLFLAGLLLAIGFNIDFLNLTSNLWNARMGLEEQVRMIEQVRDKVDAQTTPDMTAANVLANDDALRGDIVGILDGIGVDPSFIGWTLIHADCDPNDAAKNEGLTCTTAAGLTKLAEKAICPENWSLMTILGWAISALLVLPGTSFWFDSLSRLLNLRSEGIKPPPASAASGEASTAGGAKT